MTSASTSDIAPTASASALQWDCSCTHMALNIFEIAFEGKKKARKATNSFKQSHENGQATVWPDIITF